MTNSELRNQYYNQIEVLSSKLKNSNFPADNYGNVDRSYTGNIHKQIDELETKISETWIK